MVERNLAKVEVASSSLVYRSMNKIEKIKPEKENFSEDEFMSRVWELYNSLKHSIETREMGLTEIAKITEDFPELSRFIEDKDEDKDENLHEKILNFLTHKLNNEKQKKELDQAIRLWYRQNKDNLKAAA